MCVERNSGGVTPPEGDWLCERKKL